MGFSVFILCALCEYICRILECISFAEFNHSLSSPKANRDVDLNHLSAFDFRMFSLILVFSELKRARTKIQKANEKTPVNMKKAF